MPHNMRQHVDAHELRGLVEQAPDAYFLHDFGGRIIDVNRRACDSLGYTRDELLQLNVFDLEQDFNLSAAQLVWGAIEVGEGVTLQGMHRRKDGSVFPVEARLSVCVMGDERLYLGLVRDVTDRKIADETLRMLAGRYQTLFSSIDEAFCVIELIYDAEGRPCDYRFLEVNPAFEKHVGILNAPGKTILELVPNIERKWIEIYGQVADSGRSVRFRDSDPSLQQRSFDVYAFRLGDESSAQVAILFSNVTDQVAAEEALKKSERLALIGRMAGVISHEINNPLDSVQNLLYMADFEEDPVVSRNYIRQAQAEVAAAARIVSHTLNFTRRTEDATREKLSDIVDSALALLSGKSKRASISVERKYGPQADVLCLNSELRQVFANFLANAFEATPGQGTVRVRVHNSTNWSTGESGVRLTIADNGCGMNEETRKNLFQAFYTTKGMNGTGLGLWVSHEILARHGVKLGLRSRQGWEGSGTVFTLWFPCNSEPKSVELLRTEELSAWLK